MFTRHRLAVRDVPYFVTVNCVRRRTLFAETRWAYDFVRLLDEQRGRYRYRLYEFVVMPDHYHAIIQPESGWPLGHPMRHINGTFAMRFNSATGQTGQVFQHGYYDHAVRDEQDYRRIATYIHNNPVRARMVTHATMYPWSSARNRLNGDDTLIRLDNAPFS